MGSEFYKKNKDLIEVNDLMLNFKLFQQKLTKKISLFLVHTKTLFDADDALY